MTDFDLNDIELLEMDERSKNHKVILFEWYGAEYCACIIYDSNETSWVVDTEGVNFSDRKFEGFLEFELELAIENDDKEDAESISNVLEQLDTIREEFDWVIKRFLAMKSDCDS